MAQGAGVGGREGRRGADTAGHDEFGTMDSPTGTREGQGLSPPVTRDGYISKMGLGCK